MDILECKSVSFKQSYIAHPYLSFILAKLRSWCVWGCCVWFFGFLFFFPDDELLNKHIHELFDFCEQKGLELGKKKLLLFVDRIGSGVSA